MVISSIVSCHLSFSTASSTWQIYNTFQLFLQYHCNVAAFHFCLIILCGVTRTMSWYLVETQYITSSVGQHQFSDFLQILFGAISHSGMLQNLPPNVVCNPHLLSEGNNSFELGINIATNNSCCCLLRGN